jgi:hypothetical protein
MCCYQPGQLSCSDLDAWLAPQVTTRFGVRQYRIDGRFAHTACGFGGLVLNAATWLLHRRPAL